MEVGTYYGFRDFVSSNKEPPRFVWVIVDWLKKLSHFLVIEFAYNNSYHSTTEMTPFEVLYRRKYHLPICWFEMGEAKFRPWISTINDWKVKLIRERMKIAQNCKKSYEDNHRELEFQKSWSFRRETSYLWRFLRQKALCSLEEKENEPRYIKPFEILKRVGAVAYRIALPLFILNS